MLHEISDFIQKQNYVQKTIEGISPCMKLMYVLISTCSVLRTYYTVHRSGLIF